MSNYDVFLTDANSSRLGQAETYEQLSVVQRFNDLGTFSIDVDGDLIDLDWLEWGGGIQILRDGELWFSGITIGIDRNVSLRRGEQSGGKKVMIWGADYNFWLSSRLAYPVPSGPPFTSASHDERTGAAGDILLQYAQYNAGSLANTNRQWPTLSTASPLGIGKSITQRARFDILLDLCKEVALKGGDIGFRFNDTELEIYEPEDKTGEVFFSAELGNLERYRLRTELPVANVVIGAGTGEGTSRDVAIVENVDSQLTYGMRIEGFYDYRNADDTAQLQEGAIARLDESKAINVVEIWPLDTEGISYPTHYDLGDKVRVQLPDLVIEDVIRELHVTLRQNQAEEIVPVVGTPESRAETTAAAKLYSRARALGRRLALLEKR